MRNVQEDVPLIRVEVFLLLDSARSTFASVVPECTDSLPNAVIKFIFTSSEMT